MPFLPNIELSLTAKLCTALGENNILPPHKIAQKYHSDWALDTPECPAGLLLPANTENVSAVLSLCHEAGQPIVVQGGLTGLASGATPKKHELALSLERLSGVESIDRNALTMTVKAGTPLAEIHRYLEGTGLCYGVDYGARELCQIGGNVATNAGGTQVIRYGMTRSQILGLTAVLADGTLIDSSNHLLKNNAGYDLKQLFIGSEGTLGVVTELVLRLYPETTSRCIGLFALKSYGDTLILLNLCRSIFGDSLNSFELMWKDYYRAATKVTDSTPLEEQDGCEQYALVEIRGRDAERDHALFKDLVEQCLAQNVLVDGAIAETDEDAESIWAVRYAVKSMLKTMDSLANFDIGVPISRMDDFVSLARTQLANALPNIETLFFGHIGDGNVHLLATTGSEQDVTKIYEIVYPLSAQFKGTISAEHGIGQQKKAKLSLSRTEAEIELMKLLKRSLDPKGILNPGRVFDL